MEFYYMKDIIKILPDIVLSVKREISVHAVAKKIFQLKNIMKVHVVIVMLLYIQKI